MSYLKDFVSIPNSDLSFREFQQLLLAVQKGKSCSLRVCDFSIFQEEEETEVLLRPEVLEVSAKHLTDLSFHSFQESELKKRWSNT